MPAITPGQSIMVNETLPRIDDFSGSEKLAVQEAYDYMSLKENTPIKNTPIDVVFIGSCTNGRISDLEEVARLVKNKKVHPDVKALVVPGSKRVQREAEQKGLHEIFKNSGFEWREPGCSMCLAMNPDQLVERQISASTSNRNFKGRQGSPSGRTLLLSPAMAAAAAIEGKISDVKEVFADSYSIPVQKNEE